MIYRSFGKRFLDILLGILISFFLLPFIILLALIISVYQKGSPLFFQDRPGKNAKIFKLIKFKSMSDLKDSEGNYLPDEKRLSTFGKFLRRTSLDELPQIVNVLKGDMSLVGPRPLLVEYLPLYNEIQSYRHLVKPGLTGWAQIHGRNDNSWKKKFEYDVWYVKHLSFFLDVEILMKTIWIVLIGKGISQEGHVTSKKFEGNTSSD